MRCPYLTGHEDFQLDGKEASALRQYLLNGGTLLAEACCGRRAFDAAFRQTMRRVLPERPLKEIAKNHLILNYPSKIERVGVTPALGAKLGGAEVTRPTLLGIDVDGHLAVIYSPYGLAGGWELTPNPYSHSYDQTGAYALGQNILLYAITQ